MANANLLIGKRPARGEANESAGSVKTKAMRTSLALKLAAHSSATVLALSLLSLLFDRSYHTLVVADELYCARLCVGSDGPTANTSDA